MGTTKHKIFLILFSLIIIFLLLEISLRFAGYIYYRMRIVPQKEIMEEGKNTIRILCLGDSFTFGLGAEHGNDYPGQLDGLLNKNYPDKKFIVYNRGIPGQNSSQVLKRLAHNITTHRPDIILLLIGSNNRTVLEDSNYYLFKEKNSGKIANFFLRADIILSKLRTYKLARITILNLKNKFKSETSLSKTQIQERPRKPEKKIDVGSHEKISGKEDYFELAQALYNERKFSAAEKIMNEIPGGYNSRNKKECLFLSNTYYEQEKYDLALAAVQDYIKDNPKDQDAVFNVGRIYYMQGRNDPTIREKNFAQAIRVFEEALLYTDQNDLKLKGEIYSYLARLYLDQGENGLAKKMTENALTYWPNNSFLKQFMRVISESSLSPEENEIFNKLLYYDFANIINLCHLYNVRIIILNYPSEKQNSIRKEIADKYKVTFIDIGSKFAELSTKYKYKDLFSDDSTHPNANGYRVMAETVFKALKHEIGVSR